MKELITATAKTYKVTELQLLNDLHQLEFLLRFEDGTLTAKMDTYIKRYLKAEIKNNEAYMEYLLKYFLERLG